MKRVSTIGPLAWLFLVGFVPAAFAGEEATITTARELHQTHQSAVVRVSITIAVDVKGMGAASKNNAMKKIVNVVGTVLDKSGLVVIASPSININRSRIPSHVDVQVHLSDARVILEDGTEIDGTVVLKDPDAGIAFLRPRKEEDGKTFANRATLSNLPTAKARILSEIIVIGRSPRMDDNA